MSISQISGSNTFSHWLGATQQLITKYNAFETNLDSIANTANTVLVIKNDTQNIYSNTVDVFNDANNVYQDIIDYTSVAYDTANAAINLSELAYDNANSAYDIATSAYSEASNAYITASEASDTAQEANTVATTILNNIEELAIQAANNVIYPIFDIDDINSDNDIYYPTLTANSDYLNKVIVSTGKMTFVPATGNLTTTTVNVTNDIKVNGQAIVNTSRVWLGETIPISKGGTGATSDSGARTALGIEIGTNVQAYSTNLTTLSGLTYSANNFIVGSGTTWISANTNVVKSALGFNLGTTANRLTITTSNGLQSLTTGSSGLYLKSAGDGNPPTWSEAPGSVDVESPIKKYANGMVWLDQTLVYAKSAERLTNNRVINFTGGATGSVTTDFSTTPINVSMSVSGTGHTHNYAGSTTAGGGASLLSVSETASTSDLYPIFANTTTGDVQTTTETNIVAVPSSGTLRCTQMAPFSTSVYSQLGLSTNRWKEAYITDLNVSGTFTLGGSMSFATILPSTDLEYNLGSSTYRWNDLYIDTITAYGTCSFEHLNPVSNNQYYLGSAALRWSYLYVNNINVSGNILPSSNLTSNIGSPTAVFNYAYVKNAPAGGSDLRLKTDIYDTDLGLNFILKLRPVKYKWKDEVSNEIDNSEIQIVTTSGVRNHYGLIAQEVEVSLSNTDFGGFIYDTESDNYFLAYSEFISPMIKAIQEQQEIIKSLELRIETLEKSANVSL